MPTGGAGFAQVAEMVSSFGIPLTLAVLFIWEKITSSKNMEAMMKELSTSSAKQTAMLEGICKSIESTTEAVRNSTAALDITNQTLSNQSEALRQHDRRAESTSGNVKLILENVRMQKAAQSKPTVKQ